MTPSRYKSKRESIGTQTHVAELLKVSPVTLSRRESGAMPITREAWLALVSLSKPKTHNATPAKKYQ